MTANNNLTTNFNVDPYYDDYDETKNFHRILYRPGFAVQARELTQQQSILQNQIHRFGNHVFRDGSEVSGASEFIDRTGVFRLKSTFAGSAIDVSSFEGKYARTRTSEQLFKVKKAVAAGGGEFNHIFVQFLQSANTTSNTVNQFKEVSNNEIVDFSSSFINGNNVFSANSGAAQIIATGDTTAARLPVTDGFLYSVDESVYYHKGLFIRSPKQTVAVAANTSHSVSVGFTSTETLITSDDDSTLTDPARGSYNYAAPGADRLKVDLTLTVKPVQDIASAPLSSNNYFEVARVQDGDFARKRPAPDYNILGDELARRTYEESGNYSVNGLTLTIANTSASTSNLVAQFSPGTAYVKGYRVSTSGMLTVEFPKARSTDSVTEQNITALYGNYLVANTFTTGIMDIDDRVELHSAATPTATTKIGEAHIRNLEYLSGSGDQRKYKLFLYDIRITSSDKVLNNIKSIVKGNYSSFTASAQVHTDSITTFNKTGDITSGSSDVRLTSAGGVQVGQVVENNAFPANTHVSSIAFDTVTLTNSATVSNTSSTIAFRSVKLSDRDFNKSYFAMPHVNVANTVNVDYKFKRKFGTVSFTSGIATIQTLSGSERFSSGTGDLANENFIVIVKSGGAGSISTGENVDMTTGSRSVTIPTPTPGNPAAATIDLDESAFNGTADIFAAIDVTADTRRVKTRNSSATKTFAGGYPANGTRLSLGYADVIKVNAIYEGNSSLVTSNTSQLVRVHGADTTMQDVTAKFKFNTGQRDSFYDHGTIELKPGHSANTNQILVDFDYYSHGGGLGFFSDTSYPSYSNIPTYTDSKGQRIYLRDTLDFRPIRSANTNSNTYITTKSFDNHQIVDSQTFEVEADYSYYKRAVHKLSLDSQRNFILTSGAAALNNPPIPEEPADSMLLATIFVNPYTYDEKDLLVQLEDNRRYTMRDIGTLETRIENLEYYSTLNLLETQVQSTQFLDDNGDARYKNGFIVDSFQGHNVGDVFNSDYKVSIDRANQVLRPRFTSDSTHLVATPGATLVQNGKRVTVPFTEAAYVSQTDASGFININPFQVVTFVGSAKLDPDRDIWIDNISIPNVTTNFQGQLDHFKHLQSMVGTEYGDWRTNTFERKEVRISGPKPEYNPQDQEYFEGGQSEFQFHTVTSYTVTNRSLKKVNSTYQPFMRSRKVFFTAEGLRPNTRLFVTMAGQNISTHAAPTTYSSTRPEQVIYDATTEQKAIITDSNGAASGYFWVPNGNQELSYAAYSADPNAQVNASLSNARGGLQIPVGTVDVLLLDKFVSPRFSTTVASSTYTATGTLNQYELVTNSSTVVEPTVVESGYFLRTGESRDTVLARNGYTNTSAVTGGPGGYTVDYMANYIGNVYRENPTINRAPEEAGYMYWLKQWDEGRFPGGLSQLVATMEQAGRENGAAMPCSQGNDPIAQTFIVPGDFYPNGIFVSSVDIFMATKDSNNLPLKVELRPTVNGFPSAEEAIPKSRVTLNPNQITANPTTPTATNVAFDSPIHLEPGEYSIVLMTDSLEYFTYIATIGDERLDGTGKITTQNTLGSLFKSQNARTWTPQQESDLTFKLYQCQFTTGTNFEITLQANNIGRVAYSANTLTSNTVGQYDVASIVMPNYDSLKVYDVGYQLKTKNLGGAVQPYVPVLTNQDLVFSSSKEISTNSDLELKVTYKTSDTNVSPYFDLGGTGISLVKNVLNAPPTGTFVAETEATDGYALSKYITRKVNLGSGLSAKSLKVFVDQNMPKGATVEVYYRVINSDDETSFNERPYVLMSRRQASIEVNEDTLRFNEYEYYADDITYTQGGATYDDFDSFSIKIVMYATSTAAAPSFRNFRAIALA